MSLKIKYNWLGVIFSVAGVFAMSNKLIIGWPIFMLANIFFVIHLYPKKEYAMVLMSIIYLFLNSWGWYNWSH